MLKRLLAVIGLSTAAAAAANPPYAPYQDAATNSIYNLLFCDDPALFRSNSGERSAPWKTTLETEPPDITRLQALAQDLKVDGRIRALAYSRLRKAGVQVPRGVLLGVITEVALPNGLDTLAAFSEGGVRYINFTGKMLFVEGSIPQTQALLPKLFSASQVAVGRLKPHPAARWAPPATGLIRFTFIASDGLYFGEGPLSAMQSDAMGGPIVRYATELMQAVVKLGVRPGA
jgi:hypothetical protein